MSARREDLGELSGEESAFRSEARARGELHKRSPALPTFPRRNYAEALAVAERARDELVERLQAGVPAVHLALGYHDPAAFKAQADIYRLVEAYRWASITLYKAAQLVCDAESIEDDVAGEHGIRFEIGL